LKKDYYKIFDSVLEDESLSYPEKILYGVIVRQSENEQGQCELSNKGFAELMHCSTSSISKWIEVLCRQGYIKRKFLYAEDSNYIEKRLIVPADKPCTEAKHDSSDSGYISENSNEASDDSPEVMPDAMCEAQPMKEEAPKPVHRNPLEGVLEGVIDEYGFDGNLRDTAIRWAQYKLDRNEIQNIDWFRQQMERLRDARTRNSDVRIIALITKSMSNGWKTIPWRALGV